MIKRICDMNIVERTALWYRLDRIGQETPPAEHPIVERPMTEKKYLAGIISDIASCKKEILILQQQVNELRKKKRGNSEF